MIDTGTPDIVDREWFGDRLHGLYGVLEVLDVSVVMVTGEQQMNERAGCG
jgi:hypothetical protein